MRRSLALIVSLTLLACATAEEGSSSGSSNSGGGSAGGGGGFVSVGGSAGELITEVYGHGPSTLYKLEPMTNVLTEIGAFDGCNYVVDLAIDRTGKMVASTLSSLWTIDPETAKCALITAGNFPNALSFLPAGTLEQNSEVLVGYINVMYVRIDTTTGAVTTVGGTTGGFKSSGDIVSVKGGGTFLTVKGPGCDDCIVEIDPLTGDITKNWGPLGFTDVYGLAFWGGSAYGFSDGGDLFQIEFNDTDVTTTVIDLPQAPPNLIFAGAGSSTAVPLEIPR